MKEKHQIIGVFFMASDEIDNKKDKTLFCLFSYK